MIGKNQRMPFPVLKTISCLTGTAAVCLGATVSLVGMVFGGGSSVRQMVCLAALVVWGSSVVAVLPVAACGPSGVLATAWGYFIGAGARFFACLAAYAWVCLEGLGPVKPLALSLAGFYVPLLAVEVAIVGRYLWSWDFVGHQQQGQGVALKVRPAEVSA